MNETELTRPHEHVLFPELKEKQRIAVPFRPINAKRMTRKTPNRCPRCGENMTRKTTHTMMDCMNKLQGDNELLKIRLKRLEGTESGTKGMPDSVKA